MEQLTTGILRRSSDAVVIIGLADGTVLDVNEAFFTMTGHARRDLVGRPGRDLLVGLEQSADPAAIEALHDLESVAEAPVGLWTRSGELRVGDLSALVLEVEGRRDALCTIRGVRDPTPGQRRSVARKELDRVLRSGDGGPERAVRALQAFGRSLRWEFGALWRSVPPPDNLRCAATWRSPQSDLQQLEEATRHAAFPAALEPLRRAWLRGEPTWIPDATADPAFARARGEGGRAMHGWLGFPVWGRGRAIGVAELLSREVRQPDGGLLAMIEDFGHLFGQILEGVEAPDAPPVAEVRSLRQAAGEPPPSTVPAAFRDLAGAIAAANQALERHPAAAAQVPQPALLGELAAGIGKLNRLLEDATQRGDEGMPAAEPPAPSPGTTADSPPALPTGLTLKAVSRRTGIPAATLRTWEHRYGFLRPRRSPSGYRLYGEEELARIEQVKYLLGQGVRIGAAMEAVMGEAGGDRVAR
jgi:PAS domain S-box-containing protein